MDSLSELKENCGKIEKKINYSFKNKELLFLAFVHRSFFNENKKNVSEHNERLEFLGDAVLNIVVAEYLYQQYPKAKEGTLSCFRSQIIDSDSCVEYVQKIGLERFVLLGKGEKQTKERGKSSILADLFEAVIGAIFLDGGFIAAKDFFMFHFEKKVEEFFKHPKGNYKADLQTHCQKKYGQLPIYEVIEEQGPEHFKIFEIAVCIKEGELGRGQGPSKKEAEQQAAKKALENL